MMIRRATADHVADLTNVLEAAYAPFLGLGLPPVTEGIEHDIRDHSVLVAELDGKIVGGIVVSLDTRAHIANLGVHPDAGGHGVGKALIAEASAAALDAGYRTIHLATHVGMTGTQAFYHKLGWEEAGREGNKVYFQKQLN